MNPIPLSLEDIHVAHQSSLTKQDYGKKPTIEGVKFHDLRTFTDDGGYFLELTRLGDVAFDAFPDFDVKQINCSEVHPQTVKAGHVHFKQEDIWFVPPSHKIIVGLMDLRKHSDTYGNKMRFVLGGGSAKLLYIPRGVAHGYSNPYTERQLIVYFVNQQFNPDPDECDEWRIPPETFGEGFWEMIKG